MERFEHFTLSVFSITRYWNKIATEEMKPYGLRGAYALYLMMLSEHEMTASQLAETTQRDKADVSRAIAAFQKKGIVEPYGTNRYRVPIRLTDKGRILVKQNQKKANDALKSAGQGLSEEMRQNMYTSLDTIADNLKEMYRKE